MNPILSQNLPDFIFVDSKFFGGSVPVPDGLAFCGSLSQEFQYGLSSLINRIFRRLARPAVIIKSVSPGRNKPFSPFGDSIRPCPVLKRRFLSPEDLQCFLKHSQPVRTDELLWFYWQSAA
jgi:hypothetical protein